MQQIYSCGIIRRCTLLLLSTATIVYPPRSFSHCDWLYFRFALSFRDVEEIMAMRGVTLSYEAIREWSLKFGQIYANDLRRRRPRPGERVAP